MNPAEDQARALDAIEQYAQQLLNPANPMATATGIQMIGHEIITRVNLLRSTCAAITGPMFPQGDWQHVQIKAGNPRVVAVQFETAEQATEFINAFAATSSPTPAESSCVKCGHNNFNGRSCEAESDSPSFQARWVSCGCACEFTGARTRVEGEQNIMEAWLKEIESACNAAEEIAHDAAEELQSLGLLWSAQAAVELGGEPFDESALIKQVGVVIARHLVVTPSFLAAHTAAEEVLDFLNFDCDKEEVKQDISNATYIISKHFAAVETKPCCFYCDDAIAQHRETGEWIHAVTGLTTCRTLLGSKHDGINHATPRTAAPAERTEVEGEQESQQDMCICGKSRKNHHAGNFCYAADSDPDRFRLR